MCRKLNYLYFGKFLLQNYRKSFRSIAMITFIVPLYDKDDYVIPTKRLFYNHWGINNYDELINVADKLFNRGLYLEVYELLNKLKYNNNANVQWRISRVLFKLSSDNTLPIDIRESMIMEAYVIMNDTISLGIEDSNIYKWMAIILDAQTRLKDTYDTEKSFDRIYYYLKKSYELNQDDIVVLYMLGKLCYEISHMTRIQRLIARILLYKKPPKTTYEDAYKFLTRACDIDDIDKCYYFIPNYYVLGKTCKHLKQYFKARYYFNRAYTVPARNMYERQCSCKAKIIDESLNGYEIYDDMTHELN